MTHSNDVRAAAEARLPCRRLRLRSISMATACCVALLLAATPKSWAWGHEGHRLTALVAEHYLTPETRAAVAELLAADSRSPETLADVAPWADEYRAAHGETAGWHFVDIPSASSFDRMRDCPPSKTDPKSPWRDCLTDRITYFEGRLGDTSLNPQERATALKFLVHLIGDAHQPFHTLADGNGGNQIHVSFMGSNQCGNYRCTLHGVWDDSLIEEQGLSEVKYLNRLLGEIQANNWQRLDGGAPVAWANVSHEYAARALAPDGALLTHDYVAEESKVVDSQLALGGLRLAHVLNRILGSQDPAPANGARTPLPAPVP